MGNRGSFSGGKAAEA